MPRTNEPACDAAMERAILLAFEAEKEGDPARRYANAALASAYVSMAKELRLGDIKSRRYSNIDAKTIGIPAPPPPGPEPLAAEGSFTLPQPPFSEPAAPQL